jgi:hypothetical protein
MCDASAPHGSTGHTPQAYSYILLAHVRTCYIGERDECDPHYKLLWSYSKADLVLNLRNMAILIANVLSPKQLSNRPCPCISLPSWYCLTRKLITDTVIEPAQSSSNHHKIFLTDPSVYCHLSAVDRIHLAQEKDQCMVLVNMVMNLLVL